MLETLFRGKQCEIDQQLIMIQSRNTPKFRHASLLQYGGVEASLRDEARKLLAFSDAEESRPRDCSIRCHALKAAARICWPATAAACPSSRHAWYCATNYAAGVMVSVHTLMISTTTRTPSYRVDALLQHEISVHLLTCVNGSAQGLQIFGTGLAGYEGIQEGLGVFAESSSMV